MPPAAAAGARRKRYEPSGRSNEENKPDVVPGRRRIASRKRKHRGGNRRETQSNKRSRRDSRQDRESTVVKDDAHGHLSYRKFDVVGRRYEIRSELGEGTFGKVVKVVDLETNDICALKIVKSKDRYRTAAKLEVRVLENIARLDDDTGSKLCIRMLTWFDYHGHICIAFKMLGRSVYDFMKRNKYQPFPVFQVRHIGYQLCDAVGFLHDHGITHTDLKPENILFVNSDYRTVRDGRGMTRVVKNSEIRIIDFGSAVFDDEDHPTIVCTRHYRAPEVILELGWNHPCDVWSIGCILFELYSGTVMFQTHDDREQLAMMERILGRFPVWMSVESKTRYLLPGGSVDFNFETSQGNYVKLACKPLEKYMMHVDTATSLLFDLIELMLAYSPADRIPAHRAKMHDFFEDLLPKERFLGLVPEPPPPNGVGEESALMR